MRNRFIKYFLASIIILLVSGCACSKGSGGGNDSAIGKKKRAINFEIISVSSWLNLMPGTDPPSFHISGDIKVLFDDENEAADLELYRIVIYQDERKLYDFRPVFSYNLRKTDTASYSEPSKELAFANDKKLPVSRDLNDEKPVSAELHFKTKSGTYTYLIEDITVEKAH